MDYGGPAADPDGKRRLAQLLDRIDETISRALKDTAAREKSLRSAATPAQRNDQGPTTDRLAGLRAHLDSAAKLADTVEALLAADEARGPDLDRLGRTNRRPTGVTGLGRNIITLKPPIRCKGASWPSLQFYFAAGQSARFKDKEKKPFATLDRPAVMVSTADCS